MLLRDETAKQVTGLKNIDEPGSNKAYMSLVNLLRKAKSVKERVSEKKMTFD